MPKLTVTSASNVSETEGVFMVSTRDDAAQWPQALRFGLLAKCDGAAPTAIGLVTSAGRAKHEFSDVVGLGEVSVPDLVLALGSVRFSLEKGLRERLISLNLVGPREVTSDELAGQGVTVLTPGLPLFSVSAGATVTLEVLVQRGRGYAAVDERAPGSTPEGLIAVGARFSPVLNATVSVRDLHSLEVRVHTDGSISPAQALAHVIAESFSS